MTKNILTREEEDQLKEVINIGAGNAATALSTMLGKQVKMTVPESFVGGIESVQRVIGAQDDKVVATFLKFHGEIEGAMVMILSPQSALNFINSVANSNHVALDQVNAEDESSLQEMGNILLGASITAINKFLDLNLIHSIPDFSINKLGAVIDSVLLEMGSVSEEILVVRVKINIDAKNIESDFYYMFDPVSSAVILEKTRAKLKKS